MADPCRPPHRLSEQRIGNGVMSGTLPNHPGFRLLMAMADLRSLLVIGRLEFYLAR